MTAATLEEVLAEVARDHDGAFCICGDLVTDPEYHLGEKQAAAVRSWLADRLADGGLREAVAEALSCGPIGDMTTYSETAHADHNRWSWRGDGHGDAIRTDYRDAATAALRAVTAALGVGEGAA